MNFTALAYEALYQQWCAVWVSSKPDAFQYRSYSRFRWWYEQFHPRRRGPRGTPRIRAV